MNVNLKTFPVLKSLDDDDYFEYERQACKWKADFEAELQKILNEIRKHQENTKPQGWDWCLNEILVKVYMEILGDE